ncbi:MAG: glycosyltransferase [Desulfobia sp.]
MRVLHVGKYFPPYAGGIENFCGDLLPALKKQGVEVAALVHQGPDEPSGEEDFSGFTVYRVPAYGRFFYTPLSPGFPGAFKRLVRDFRPDLIHFHLPNPSAFWALLLPSVRKIPWIVHWHSDVVSSKIERSLALAYQFYKPFEQLMLARAAVVICTSKPYMESSLPLRKWREKCRIIPLGIDPERYGRGQAGTEPGRDGLPVRLDKNNFNVLAVGRLTYYKGHEVLIRAAAGTRGVGIYIVGKGEKQKELEKLIETAGVADKVTLAGFMPDHQLRALMERADCLCLPSVERTEAFGLVLLEGMYYRKPLVASDVAGSGMGWVVDDRETGFLVPPGDDQKLAGALQFLADDRGLAVETGRRGKEKFDRLFQINRVAREVEKVYRRPGQ